VVDFLFRPRLYKHAAATQAQYDAESKTLGLFQYAACPFCVKVRWAIRKQGLIIPLMDAKRNAQYAKELVEGGGQLKVPCLRIEKEDGSAQWLYESSDIIHYLSERFPKQSA
tara:strand:+ start:23618 stop:23953 length:336 start_codon:yes stop_codon:yes gene_type:complete